MNFLLDTNILGRLAEPTHSQYRPAKDATDTLRRGGDIPCVIPQVLYEFWVVATRPVAQNGLGMTATQADGELARIESIFPLLGDTSNLYAEWRRLVTSHSITGKNSHDTRIVAAMSLHGIDRILTFNSADFARYPGIIVLDPVAIVAAAIP